MSKTPESYFGRDGAHLCTGDEKWSWKSKDFQQIIVVDEVAGKIVGNVQLHFFEINGKTAVLARINPTEAFMDGVDIEHLAKEYIKMVKEFANMNGVDEVYLPEQTGWHQLTNRDKLCPYLQKFYGTGRIKKSIQITGKHWVEGIYRCK